MYKNPKLSENAARAGMRVFHLNRRFIAVKELFIPPSLLSPISNRPISSEPKFLVGPNALLSLYLQFSIAVQPRSQAPSGLLAISTVDRFEYRRRSNGRCIKVDCSAIHLIMGPKRRIKQSSVRSTIISTSFFYLLSLLQWYQIPDLPKDFLFCLGNIFAFDFRYWLG